LCFICEEGREGKGRRRQRKCLLSSSSLPPPKALISNRITSSRPPPRPRTPPPEPPTSPPPFLAPPLNYPPRTPTPIPLDVSAPPKNPSLVPPAAFPRRKAPTFGVPGRGSAGVRSDVGEEWKRGTARSTLRRCLTGRVVAVEMATEEVAMEERRGMRRRKEGPFAGMGEYYQGGCEDYLGGVGDFLGLPNVHSRAAVHSFSFDVPNVCYR
ncbi:unnamed protein product, partial [Musa textilis]